MDMEDSTSSAAVQLKTLSSSKSRVWKYFGFLVDKNGAVTNKKQVVCRICDRTITYSGNTTNLFYQLS